MTSHAHPFRESAHFSSEPMRPFRSRLLTLLHRWAEREVIRTNGRALIIPSVTYRWRFNPIGGLEICGEGVCWERMTARPESSDLDEFGVAIRKLAEIEQALIITDVLGRKEEWEEVTQFYGLSNREASRALRSGWGKLVQEVAERGLI